MNCGIIYNVPIKRSKKEGEDKNYMNLNYFQICSLLYIIDNNKEYDDVRSMIITEINQRLSKTNAMSYADNAMLFFDTMTCPYIDKHKKKDLLKSLFGYTDERKAFSRLKKYNNTTNRWFFNWDKSCSLSELLSKKEYHSPYE